jgi:hypothetical protein
MTTPHTSADNAYPFIFGPLPVEARGIVDLWFVVQGPPDRVVDNSSSSGALDPHSIMLVLTSPQVGYTEYKFVIAKDIYRWDVFFQVPHDTPGTGIVQNEQPSSVQAVLTYNENNILKTGSPIIAFQVVEPARVVFYHEVVSSVTFQNISRCNGVESTDREDVLALGPGDADIEIGDGYNCELSGDSEQLTLNASNGAGLGNAPSVVFGNTEGCEESSSSGVPTSGQEVSLVRTVNGITPADGNLVVSTSRLVGKEKAVGKLTLIVRRA